MPRWFSIPYSGGIEVGAAVTHAVGLGGEPNPTSRAARTTARWRGFLSTTDLTIVGTSLPEPAPTPFPDWQTPRATLTSGPTGEVSCARDPGRVRARRARR